jgi:hypothetical protein
MRDLVKPVRWTQPADTLMRTLEVVVLYPQLCAVLHVLEPFKKRPVEKLLLDRLPEPLNLSLRLRVVRLRPDVFDLHPVHLLLKLRLTAPARVLPAVVRQHLCRGLVLRCRPPEYLQHIVRFLRHVQPHACYKPGKIVYKADQVYALLPPRNHTDVRLPHQVRALYIRASFVVRPRGLCNPLRTRTRRFTCGKQRLLMQHPSHRLMTCLHKKHPLQNVRYPVHSMLRLGFLHRNYLLLYRGRQSPR